MAFTMVVLQHELKTKAIRLAPMVPERYAPGMVPLRSDAFLRIQMVH